MTRSSCCGGKAAVFLLTFFSYAMFHVSRKSFSVIKSEMNRELWMESSYIPKHEQGRMYGLMDTLFMAFYACGLYGSGVLGDRHDLRILLTIGMLVTAAITVSFGLAAFFGIHSLGLYAFLWALNGLIQSVGWPANVAVMGHWFNKSERGAVMGIWSANASFGNIMGTAFVALIFIIFPDKAIAWKFSMVGAGVLVGVHAIFVYMFLQPKPASTISLEEAVDTNALLKPHETERRQISFLNAWFIPGVIPYALSYACLKSVNYALFFWLPFYLTMSQKMSDADADMYSMLYDVGQIAGGFVGGFLTDKLGSRSPVITIMLILATYVIQLFNSPEHHNTTFLLLTSGFLLGGPASLISTAISADLGTHESLRGNNAALATVAGIIDGTGSFGAALVQYLVGYLANCHPVGDTTVCTWDPVFALLKVGGIMSCFFLLPMLWREVIPMCYRRHGV